VRCRTQIRFGGFSGGSLSSSRYPGIVLHRWCSCCVALGLSTLGAGSAAAAPEPGADDTDAVESSASADDSAEPTSDEDAAEYEMLDEPDVEGEPIAPEGEGESSMVRASQLAEPMVEIVAKDKKVRHDWYIGFGLGVGAGASFIQETNDLGLAVDGGVKPGWTAFVHSGGRLGEKLYLGARLATVTGGSAGGTSLMAEALYFPVKNRGLLLGAAVGPSLIYVVDVAAGEARVRRPGAGVAVDVGYDFWLLRRLNLGIVLQGNAALNGKQAHVIAGTLGLQLNWY